MCPGLWQFLPSGTVTQMMAKAIESFTETFPRTQQWRTFSCAPDNTYVSRHRCALRQMGYTILYPCSGVELSAQDEEPGQVPFLPALCPEWVLNSSNENTRVGVSSSAVIDGWGLGQVCSGSLSLVQRVEIKTHTDLQK